MNKRKLQEIEHPLDYSLWVTLLLTGTVAAVALPDYVKLGVSAAANTVGGAIEQVKQAPKRAVSAVRSQLPAFVPGSTRTSAIIKNPRLRAALDTIAWAEGTYHKPNTGYNTLFGGGQISDLSKHPNICISFGKTCSTAFGRYQGLNRTWFGTVGHIPVTPENQDKFAIKLLRQCGVVDDILAGNPKWIIDPCVGRTWASFPVNPYGQPQKSGSVLTAQWKAFMK